MDGHATRREPGEAHGHAVPTRRAVASPRSRARSRTPTVHRWCDILTEALLYFMIVFSPWAFGTTERWSIWTMNVTAYGLGALLATKWIVRWRTGWQPDRWDAAPEANPDDPDSLTRQRRHRLGTWLTRTLATLTVLVLLYTLISAVNARVVYFREEGERFMAYLECVRWLPHSYDRGATWFAFWQYLGLAGVFWSLRDWLLTRTGADRAAVDESPPLSTGSGKATEVERHGHESRTMERSRGSGGPSDTRPTQAMEPNMIERARGARPSEVEPRDRYTERAAEIRGPLPARLRRLLWVLSINGAVLALECILQRLSGTNKLLWLVVPHINADGESQLGPYAYRSNAAQYFNLLWPVCLAFWWREQQGRLLTRGRTVRAGTSAHMLLLPCAALLALGPLMSLSRGGVVIAVAGLVISGIVLWASAPSQGSTHKVMVTVLFTCILTLGAFLGWKQLRPRLELAMRGDMSGREEAYKNATQMLNDHARLGAGPGAFSTVYEHYRGRTDEVVHAYLHDDWMEFQITFGRYGYALILVGLFLLLSSWAFSSGIAQPSWFMALLLLPLLGCLAHARLDFPFQIYSIFLLFVIVGAILHTSSRGR